MTYSELLDLMKLGGITMAVILAGSVLSIVIGLERMLFLRGFSARSVELHESVVKALLRGDVAQASAECNRSQVATASIYRAALDRMAKPERVWQVTPHDMDGHALQQRLGPGAAGPAPLARRAAGTDAADPKSR